MSCYSADLLLRQYEQVKNRLKKHFNYSSINKVYTIVIFENTDSETTNVPVYQAFHAEPVADKYLHHGKITFDTGLNLEFLQEFYLISLDVFREVGYAKDDKELTAWLSLLATNTYEDASLLCQKYPWMNEIFEEISEYIHNPEEVVRMFSEALKMMDDNMYQYMADQHMALVKEQQGKIDNLCTLLIEQMKENNKSKEDAVIESIEGYQMTDAQKYRMRLVRAHMDYITAEINDVDSIVENLISSSPDYKNAVQLLCTIPSVKHDSAITIISEISIDMSQFL